MKKSVVEKKGKLNREPKSFSRNSLRKEIQKRCEVAWKWVRDWKKICEKEAQKGQGRRATCESGLTPKSHSFSLGNFAKQIAKRILWQSKLPSRRQRKRQTLGVNSFGFQGVSNTRSPSRREARQGKKRSQVRGVNSLFLPPKVNAKPLHRRPK